MNRRQELADSLALFEQRVSAACARAGRPRRDIGVVVVTKGFPAEDVRALDALGVRDVGENRAKEAAEKARECADLALRWHFVGQLQSNKAAVVAAFAEVVQSVDRPALVSALSRAAQAAGRDVGCLVQVALGPTQGELGRRGGATPAEVMHLADAVTTAERLRLDGVMGVAPHGEDPRPAFEELVRVAARLQAVHPTARVVSAGMSGDFEAAILAGATHLRVGTAVLGSRRSLR